MKRIRQEGMTMVEVLIAVALMAILLALGTPTFATWAQNRQIRTAAESIQNGLMLARSEAVSRNTNVRFQLLTTADDGCGLSEGGPQWGVSLVDPTASCGQFFVDPPNQNYLQLRAINEGSPNAQINGNGVTTVIFNGMGQTTTSATIDVSNPTGGACRTIDGNNNIAGAMSCLRVVVSSGGQVRMCDPFTGLPQTDPRRC